MISVLEPDPVGSGIIRRIRIRNSNFGSRKDQELEIGLQTEFFIYGENFTNCQRLNILSQQVCEKAVLRIRIQLDPYIIGSRGSGSVYYIRIRVRIQQLLT